MCRYPPKPPGTLPSSPLRVGLLSVAAPSIGCSRCPKTHPVFHSILTLLAPLLKREHASGSGQPRAAEVAASPSATASDLYMRRNLGLLLQGLQTSLAQNQLRFGAMAR